MKTKIANALLNSIVTIIVILTVKFSVCNAQELTDNLYLNGFFSVDATTTTNNIALVSNSGRVQSYEADEFSFNNSIIGAQLSYELSDNLNIFTQAKAYINQQNSLDYQFDWAYLSYDLGADLSLRLGKVAIPFLQGIELRNIGFARLWARPLIPSSGAGGFRELTGAEILKHISKNDHHWDMQLTLGQASHGVNTIDSDTMAVFSTKYQYHNFWLRSALLRANYSVSNNDGGLITDSGKATMLSIESEISHNNYIINIGLSTSSNDYNPNDSMYYLSFAYQFDHFTAFIYGSHFNQHFDAPENNVPDKQMVRPPTSTPPTNTPQQSQNGDIYVYSLVTGVKYLFNESYALKMQFEHLKNDNQAEINNRPSREGQALTLVLDGVF